jgi:hypothetical protein
MTYLLSYPNYRSRRLQLADDTPAVLRLCDGHRSRGKLETISLTGGLLSLSTMLDQGSLIKLMFVTHTGPISGAAEMLSPVSPTRQPFRFVSVEDSDRRRLRAVLQLSSDQNRNENPGRNAAEQAWIEKYRATLLSRNPPRRRYRVILGSLLTLCSGTAIYFLHFHRLR